MTRIVQISDLHVFADADTRLYGIPTREVLREVVAHIREHAGRVDHLVVTGDHTHDELPETYRAVRQILEPWLARLWQVPGNHDDRATLQSVFGDRTGGVGLDRVTFSFRAGDWLCLGLDTQVPGAVSGLVEADQLAWVRRQLDEHEPQAAALFMHHPPVLLGSPWLDRIGLDGRELLQELLVEDARVRLVCCGHVHHESTHHVGRASIVTTPSTGLQFDPSGEVTAFASDPAGYRIVDLGDRGAVSTRVVRLPEARYAPVAG